MDNSFSWNPGSYLIGCRNVLLPPFRQHRTGTERQDHRVVKGCFAGTGTEGPRHKSNPCSSKTRGEEDSGSDRTDTSTGSKARSKENSCAAGNSGTSTKGYPGPCHQASTDYSTKGYTSTGNKTCNYYNTAEQTINNKPKRTINYGSPTNMSCSAVAVVCVYGSGCGVRVRSFCIRREYPVAGTSVSRRAHTTGRSPFHSDGVVNFQA